MFYILVCLVYTDFEQMPGKTRWIPCPGLEVGKSKNNKKADWIDHLVM